MKLLCYVCGKPPGNTFLLMSMQEESDRVYIVDTECQKQVDNDDTQKCVVVRL